MVYSLTDKLSFDDPPKIEVKGKLLTINNSAVNVLKLMDIIQTKGEVEGTRAILETLFSKEDRKTIDSLNLSMADYTKFCEICMDLAVGNDPDNKKGE